jgi:hypothetical protein
MGIERSKFSVVEIYRDVEPFIVDVQSAADNNRTALGFFPSSLYAEFARRGQLYVALVSDSLGSKYVGHLMFDCRYPRAHVLQMSIDASYRKFGVASMLLKSLCSSLTESGFISIYARVAEDLQSANAFWAKKNFYVQRSELGGKTRKRMILVRAHELASPQLFDSSGLSQFNPLGLPGIRTTVPPLFLIDLNVLFDFGPRRPRHSELESLYQAERMNFCRLAISSEIREELKRTAVVGKTDPMDAFVSFFPTFPLSKTVGLGELFEDLRKLIFPQKQQDKLTPNDHSDLAHVATVVQHKLAGLVTNDEAILRASPALQNRFGIRVVSSAAFAVGELGAFEPTFVNSSAVDTLESRRIDNNDDASVRSLLVSLGVTGSSIAGGWIPVHESNSVTHRIGVWLKDSLLGYLIWPAWTPHGPTVARIALDESSNQARDAARALLMHLLAKTGSAGPHNLLLEFPSQQSHIREIAFGLGFSGSPSSSALVKLVDGGVWTPENWTHRQADLAKKVGLKLPDSALKFRNLEQQIQVLTPDGNRAHISLDMLETLLAPCLFCLDSRPAVITPIQRSFSEPLLGHSDQGSLLPDFSSSLFAQKHFVSTSRSLKHFSRGTIILFYESGKKNGRSALVAIAKVQAAYLREASMLSTAEYERSVLTAESLESIGTEQLKTVTVFDSIFALPKQIPLTILEELGCGRPTDLITTRPITADQLQAILKRAFPN